MEVIVSLFVLSIGFLGVVNLSTTALRNSFLQRDAIIASMLVQEGSELVYNVRDTNIVKGDDLFLGISNGSYRISPDAPTLTSGPYQLSLSTNGIYGYSGSNPTKFSRKIIIVEGLSSSGGKDRTVTSVVVWGDSTFPSTITGANCNKLSRCAFAQMELQEN